MATQGFVYYDGPFQTVELKENGSTWAIGDLLYINGGYAAIATAGTEIGYVALKASTGVTGAMTPVIPILPEQKWVAQAGATTAQTNVGFAGPVTYTTGSMAVTPETSDTSPETFIVDALDPRDGATTGAGGRVIGRFNVQRAREVWRTIN